MRNSIPIKDHAKRLVISLRCPCVADIDNHIKAINERLTIAGKC
jgi:hypothetical protein